MTPSLTTDQKATQKQVTCGSLHADSELRDSLGYDIVEPFRARLDSALLGWVGA